MRVGSQVMLSKAMIHQVRANIRNAHTSPQLNVQAFVFNFIRHLHLFVYELLIRLFSQNNKDGE